MALLPVAPTAAEAVVAVVSMVAEAEVPSAAEVVATLEAEVVAVEAIINAGRSIELRKPANQSPAFFFTSTLHTVGERWKPSPPAKPLPRAHPDRGLRFRLPLESPPFVRSRRSSGC